MEANRVEEKQQPELHMPPALGPHPWLVYFHGEHGQSQTLYSMIEVVIRFNYRHENLAFNCCFLALPPDDPNCIIVFFGIIRNHIHYFMFCKPGDIEWTKHDLLLPIAEDLRLATGALRFRILKLTERDSSLGGGHWCEVYMVETCGELFRVDQYITHEKAVFLKFGFGEENMDQEFKETKSILLCRKIRVLYEYDISMGSVGASLPCSNVKDNQMPSAYDTMDVCNLGSLSCSMDHEKLSEIKLGPLLTSNDFNKSSDPKCELSGEWRCKYDENPELEQAGKKSDAGEPVQGGKNASSYCGASLSEDNEALTESKIRAFLAEKALELRKLQTPLYEEFYNNLNAPSSPSFGGSSRDETPPNYLKLPPKSRSPSQVPVGSPSTSTDAVSTRSPGSNKRASNVGNASDQASEDNSSPRGNDWKALPLDDQPETASPSVRQRKWKEELDQELESKREMIRHAGSGSKTSSPRDRASSRQRERTRFASPSK
ncbi:hypothetical protein NC653_012795 [Populus alba x Populus x berolinensis]|uniref:Uncharacterized protein n=1 Tax=Populus alba x Populus x berolinensis TaxID=444605 RepID=A0AAD6W2P5_9ROSI|nr:hypothetical protein NC653_012795 [Populus alba x Populus x berolinensis]